MALPAEADVRLLIHRLVPGADYRWMSNDGSVGTLRDIDWRDARTEPTEAAFEAEWTIVLSERATEDATKNSIDTNVNAFAGRTVAALTDAQRVTLLEGILFRLGGIESDGTIRASSRWLDR